MKFMLNLVSLDLRSAGQDPALIMQLFAAVLIPFLAVILPDTAAPALSDYTGADPEILKGVLRGFLIQLPSLLSAMLAGGIALEEKEENIIRIYRISPSGIFPWYASRIVTGLIITGMSSSLMVAAGIQEIVCLFPILLLMTSGIWYLIFLAASDRIQGLAAGKAAGALVFLGSAAHLFPEPVNGYFFWIPSWWIVHSFIP